MREQAAKIAVLEASKRIGVSKTTVRALIERGEIDKVQDKPVLVSLPSVVRYIARTTTYEEVQGKTKVVSTHLGQIRKILKYDAYLIKDLKNLLGITNTNAISKNKIEECHLSCEECEEHGLRPFPKGYSLIKLNDINKYLKSCTYNIDKDRLMTELMYEDLKDKLPDAKVKTDNDGVIDIDLTNEQVTIEEVQSKSKSEIEVLDQREMFGKQFKIYGTANEPLFLAKDVAGMIGYDKSSVNKMLKNVDEHEKVRNIIPTLGGNQETWFLTEDGLYEVLMQSRKPIAKQFKIQIKEILKTIRTTGGYVAPSQESRFVEHYLSDLPESTKKAIAESIASRNAELKILRAQKYEEYRCLDTEIKANESVMNKLTR